MIKVEENKKGKGCFQLRWEQNLVRKDLWVFLGTKQAKYCDVLCDVFKLWHQEILKGNIIPVTWVVCACVVGCLAVSMCT